MYLLAKSTENKEFDRSKSLLMLQIAKNNGSPQAVLAQLPFQEAWDNIKAAHTKEARDASKIISKPRVEYAARCKHTLSQGGPP